MIYRLAGEPTVSGTLDDYPYAPKVSESGRDAVTWAWNNGLITEKECVWYPTQAISRAQFVTILAGIYGVNASGGMPFSDVGRSWYYLSLIHISEPTRP